MRSVTRRSGTGGSRIVRSVTGGSGNGGSVNGSQEQL